MGRPRLLKAQRLALLTWIAADHEIGVIRSLATAFDPPFEVTRRQLNYYRTRYGGEIQSMREQRWAEAISRGLAVKEERVARLQRLAGLYERRIALFGYGGDIADVTKATKEYRETLHQIAQEMKIPPEGIAQAYLAAVDRIIDKVLYAVFTVCGQALFERVMAEVSRVRESGGVTLPGKSQGHKRLPEGTD